MAFTNTVMDRTVWGNKALKVFKCTSDANATGVVTGFKVVTYAWYAPNSLTTLGLNMKINSTNGGTDTNGTIAVSSLTSGDDFYLYVVGR